MALALSHAPPKAQQLTKLPVAQAAGKAGAAVHAEKPHVAAPQGHAKFQALLDQAAHTLTEKVKLPKAKATEVPAEKPKEAPKKHEAKDHRSEGAELALAATVTAAPAPKAEVKAVVPESPDKAKPVKTEKRSESASPVAVNAEATKAAQVQAPSPAQRSERTEDKPKVFVVDRRTDAKEREKLKLPGAEAAAQQPVAPGAEAQTQAKVVDQKVTPSDVAVSFQNVSGKARDGFESAAAPQPVSPRDAASFQQYLVDKGYGQLVDQARIVLKDQNAGEIRMTLYPESLGKVKVALNLNDNSLAGQISVENQTVKDVFQDNLEGLLSAFRDGGWNDVSLQVSVGNGNGGQTPGQAYAGPTPQARDYDKQVTQTADGSANRIGAYSDRQINLTA